MNITCPFCNASYDVNDNLCGKKVQCPVCESKWIVSESKQQTPQTVSALESDFSVEARPANNQQTTLTTTTDAEKQVDLYSHIQKQAVTRPPQFEDINPYTCVSYELPPISLLNKPEEICGENEEYLDFVKITLQETLDSFGIDGTIGKTMVGPRFTWLEINLQPGVRVETVLHIQNNIAKDIRAESIHIWAPVPGSNTIRIELPNKVSNKVFLRELMESDTWRNTKAKIPIILGKDMSGNVKITDLAEAPHLLITGITGSGKSVCLNTIIMSLLFKFSPFELKLILVDTKYVEFELFRYLPHLITELVNDQTKVPYVLRWGVKEMEHRYRQMARVKAKNLETFNNRPPDPEPVMDENGNPIPQKLPRLIIIVDELTDTMMTEAATEVETSICKIAQKGHAAGIHLVIASQMLSKDIITDVIKENLKTKIAFKVSTCKDSRIFLDSPGAEKLLNQGDMLFKGPDGELERIQGSMVSDPEIQKISDFVSSQVEQHFDTTVVLENKDSEDEEDDGENSFHDFEPEEDNGTADYLRNTVNRYMQPGDDENIRKALEIILRENKASTSYLQRRMGIGYNKAAEILDVLEQRGIVSAPLAGGQKRNIIIFDELNRSSDDNFRETYDCNEKNQEIIPSFSPPTHTMSEDASPEIDSNHDTTQLDNISPPSPQTNDINLQTEGILEKSLSDSSNQKKLKENAKNQNLNALKFQRLKYTIQQKILSFIVYVLIISLIVGSLVFLYYLPPIQKLFQWYQKSRHESFLQEVDKIENGDSLEIIVFAQQVVEKAVKSPATLRFKRNEVVTRTDKDYRMKNLVLSMNLDPQKMWVVAGDFDAQNSFGAIVRTRYSAVIECEGGHRYKLHKIEFIP